MFLKHSQFNDNLVIDTEEERTTCLPTILVDICITTAYSTSMFTPDTGNPERCPQNILNTSSNGILSISQSTISIKGSLAI